MQGGKPRVCKGESPPWQRLSLAREKDNAELTDGPGSMGVSGPYGGQVGGRSPAWSRLHPESPAAKESKEPKTWGWQGRGVGTGKGFCLFLCFSVEEVVTRH